MTNVNKIALVTGAGSGVGRAVALGLLEAGYIVILAGRRPEALEATAGCVADRSAQIVCVPTDITDSASVAALFGVVQQRFGRLDLLFNNAGIAAPAVAFEDLTDDAWRAVVDTNITGAFFCARAAFRIMKDQAPQGGRIINNGSISAQVPRPLSAPYTATKHALTGLTRSLSLDGRPYNIAVGQIDIGNAETEMTAGMPFGSRQANGSLAAEPTMDVRQVADAVLYVANLTLAANVQFLTVMATNMPFIGRG